MISDILIGLCIFLLAFSVSHQFITEYFRFDDFMNVFFLASGHGFSQLSADTMKNIDSYPELKKFINNETDRFPSESIRDNMLKENSYFAHMHAYLHHSIALTLRLFGLTRSTFIDYLCFLYGALFIILYGVFRIGMGRIVSTLCVMPLLFSQEFLKVATGPRDFSKSLFMLLTILAIGLIVRYRLNRRALIILSGFLGTALGFGLGFRTDIIVCIPIFIVMVIFFYRRDEGPVWKEKLAACLIFLVMFSLFASPVIPYYFGAHNAPSNVPHVILLGLANGDVNPVYGFSVVSHDGYVAAVINSYNQRIHGSKQYDIFSSNYDKAGKEVLLEYIKNFPADFLARLYSAILTILQLMPAGIIAAIISLLIIFVNDLRTGIGLFCALAYFLGYTILQFGERHLFYLEFVSWWFLGFVIQYLIGLVVTKIKPYGFKHIIMNYRMSKKIGLKWLSLLFSICALCTLILWMMGLYQQFHLRTCIMIQCLIGLVMTIIKPYGFKRIIMNYRMSKKIGLKRLGLLFSICAFCTIILWMTRLYQQFHLRTCFESYYNASYEPLERVMITDLLSGRESLYQLTDGLGDEVRESSMLVNGLNFGKVDSTGDDFHALMKSEYLMADFDCSKTAGNTIRIAFRFDPPLTIYSQSLTIDCSSERGITRVLFPVYCFKNVWFRGIEIDKKDYGSLVRIGRVKELDKYPLLLKLQLSPDWKKKPLYCPVTTNFLKLRNIYEPYPLRQFKIYLKSLQFY